MGMTKFAASYDADPGLRSKLVVVPASGTVIVTPAPVALTDAICTCARTRLPVCGSSPTIAHQKLVFAVGVIVDSATGVLEPCVKTILQSDFKVLPAISGICDVAQLPELPGRRLSNGVDWGPSMTPHQFATSQRHSSERRGGCAVRRGSSIDRVDGDVRSSS